MQIHLSVKLDAAAFIWRIASAVDLKFLQSCGRARLGNRTRVITLQCPFDSEVRIRGAANACELRNRDTAMPERQPSDAVVRAWARLIRAQQAVLAAVEAGVNAPDF